MLRGMQPTPRALLAALDPNIQRELAREHEAFAEDLELLQWLLETTPDSPDVVLLTESLVRRLRQHLERDGRLLRYFAALSERT